MRRPGNGSGQVCESGVRTEVGTVRPGRHGGDRRRAAQPEARVGPGDDSKAPVVQRDRGALLIVLTLTFLFSALMISAATVVTSRRPSPADTGMGSRPLHRGRGAWPWFWPNFAGCRIGPPSFRRPFIERVAGDVHRFRAGQVARCFYVAGRDPCSSAWRASRHRAPSRPPDSGVASLSLVLLERTGRRAGDGPILPDRLVQETRRMGIETTGPISMEWWWCGRRRFGLMVFADRSKRSWPGKPATPDTASRPLCACSGGGGPVSRPVEGVYWLEGKRMKRLTVIVARAVALGAVRRSSEDRRWRFRRRLRRWARSPRRKPIGGRRSPLPGRYTQTRICRRPPRRRLRHPVRGPPRRSIRSPPPRRRSLPNQSRRARPSPKARPKTKRGGRTA